MRVFVYNLLLIGCLSCANVKQIDRGRLASRPMALDPIPEESMFLNEVNSFRESAVGGTSAIGGGCGCN